MVLYLNNSCGVKPHKDGLMIGPEFFTTYKEVVEEFCRLKDFSAEITIPSHLNYEVFQELPKTLQLVDTGLYLHLITLQCMIKCIKRYTNFDCTTSIVFADINDADILFTSFKEDQKISEFVSSGNFTTNPLEFCTLIASYTYNYCKSIGLDIVDTKLGIFQNDLSKFGISFVTNHKQIGKCKKCCIAYYSIEYSDDNSIELISPEEYLTNLNLINYVRVFMLDINIDLEDFKDFVESGMFYETLVDIDNPNKIARGSFINFTSSIFKLWDMAYKYRFFSEESFVTINESFIREIMSRINKMNAFTVAELDRVFNVELDKKIGEYSNSAYDFFIKYMSEDYMPTMKGIINDKASIEEQKYQRHQIQCVISRKFHASMLTHVNAILDKLCKEIPLDTIGLEDVSMYKEESYAKDLLWYTCTNYKIFVLVFAYLFSFIPFQKLVLDYRSILKCSGFYHLANDEELDFRNTPITFKEHQKRFSVESYKATTQFFSSAIASAIALGFHAIEFYELDSILSTAPFDLDIGRSLTSILSGNFFSLEHYNECVAPNYMLATYSNVIMKGKQGYEDETVLSPAIIIPSGKKSDSSTSGSVPLYDLNLITQKLLDIQPYAGHEDILTFLHKKSIPKMVRNSKKLCMQESNLNNYIEVSFLDVARLLYIRNVENYVIERGLNLSNNTYFSMTYVALNDFIISILKLLSNLIYDCSKVITVPDVVVLINKSDFNNLKLSNLVQCVTDSSGTTELMNLSSDTLAKIPQLYITLKQFTQKSDFVRDVKCFTAVPSSSTYRISNKLAEYGKVELTPKRAVIASAYQNLNDNFQMKKRFLSSQRGVQISNLSFGLRNLYRNQDQKQHLTTGDVIWSHQLHVDKQIDLTSLYLWLHIINPDWIGYMSKALEESEFDLNVPAFAEMLLFRPYIKPTDLEDIFQAQVISNNLGCSTSGQKLSEAGYECYVDCLGDFIWFGPVLLDSDKNIIHATLHISRLQKDYQYPEFCPYSEYGHSGKGARTISIVNDSVWEYYKSVLSHFGLLSGNVPSDKDMYTHSSPLGWYMMDHTLNTQKASGSNFFMGSGILYNHYNTLHQPSEYFCNRDYLNPAYLM